MFDKDSPLLTALAIHPRAWASSDGAAGAPEMNIICWCCAVGCWIPEGLMHCMCGITAWTALLALLPAIQCADVVACPPAVAGCVDGGEMPRVRVFYMQWPVCCFCFLIFPLLLPLISNFILFSFFCFYSPSSSCITQMRQIPLPTPKNQHRATPSDTP